MRWLGVDVEEVWAKTVGRALGPEPEGRWQSAADMFAALQRLPH